VRDRTLAATLSSHFRGLIDRELLHLSFAKMVMGGGPTLHHENRLPFQRADVRIRR
jgi:hypothetical protein